MWIEELNCAYSCIHSPSKPPIESRLPQNSEMSHRHTAGHCWLSILNIAVMNNFEFHLISMHQEKFNCIQSEKNGETHS